MTTDSSLHDSHWIRNLAAGILTCIGVSLLIVSGCDSGVKPPPPPPPPPNMSVESILQNLQPDVYGITVPRTLPRGDLDDWAKSMLADMVDQDVDDKTLAEQLSRHLSREQVDRIIRRQFVLQDCTHVRDMLWARDLFGTIHVPWQGNGDLDQIAAVFYHVMHTILPARQHESTSPPIGPFEAMLHGRGSAEDRAWAFAIILQQRRIPVVVLAIPDDAAGSEPDFLLMGVVIESDVYLFDAVLGLAVPGPEDATEDVLIRRPATLAEVIADDGLLRQLDVADRPYPVTSEQLKQASLQLVGDTSLWSRRMEGLNNALTGSAVVYAPLVGESGMIPLLTGALANQVAADRIRVWSYPDRQRQARESLSPEQQTALDAWNASLQVPYQITVVTKPDQPAQLVVEPVGRQSQRVARVDQILGQAQKAIPRFLKVQGWRDVPPLTRNHPPIQKDAETNEFIHSSLPENIRRDHAVAADQARFWRACCQLQQGKWTAAANDLESYFTAVKQGTGLSGMFRNQAAYLCGVALAFDGKFSRAAAFMRLIPADDPAIHSARLLEKRWSARTATE
jgi:hypothetical protein